jgi:multicomponent Na+:H+ antiporter subunit A
VLAIVVILGFPLALLAPWCVRKLGPVWAPRLFVAYPLLVFVVAALTPFDPAQVQTSFAWAPRYGLRWSVLVDGWSLLFTLLISGIGALVVAYAGEYLRDHPQIGRFYLYLLGFMAAMLGVVLASNLLLLFVCWELTGLFSYLLIGFEHASEKARKSALQALLTTGVGGLALLVAAVLLYSVAGTWEISELLRRTEAWPSTNMELWIIGLLCFAAFTKSAQFPFHYWLPAAMAAPTPVSAYLHSATMVKAGVFLLARMTPLFQGSWVWHTTLLAVGGATMVAGALLAVGQRDLKLLLAYSTVSALGTLVFLLGVNDPAALAACVVFLAAHALYKGGLFFFAGAIDHATGERDVEKLGRLYTQLPFLGSVATVLALSMAGILPTFGFVAKELAYETVLHAGPWGIAAALVFASALQVAVAGFVVVRPLFATAPRAPSVHHAPGWEMCLGPALLALASLIFGLAPFPALQEVLRGAATAIAANGVSLQWKLWHGLTPAFLLSLATLAFGAVAFALRRQVLAVTERARVVAGLGPAAMYEGAVAGLLKVAAWQTRKLQSGKLRSYQSLVLLVAVAAPVFAWSIVGSPDLPPLVARPPFVTEVVVLVTMLAGTAVAIVATSRLTAIAGLGVAGYGVGVLFLLFGAPDLAMTQFAIETLTVLLFVLVLYRLPRFETRSDPATRVRDALLASAVGLAIGGSMAVVLARPTPSVLAPFFLAESVPSAHGRNVVNVILVDFRSLDTLGEITVLGLAAMGVGALMAAWRRRP